MARCARLGGLDTQLAALKEQQAELNATWEAERDEMSKVQALKGEIDRSEHRDSGVCVCGGGGGGGGGWGGVLWGGCG